MFKYSDPTGSNVLNKQKALLEYRLLVHDCYRQMAVLPNSSFTLLEAFDQGHQNVKINRVSWIAYPRNVAASSEEIDSRRFKFQEEYVEWRVEKDASGHVKRITFTTEFPEYYEALARVGVKALINGIKNTIPKARPTHEELFGPAFDPEASTPDERAYRFRRNALRNPWNNGEKDILFLSHPSSSMGALVNLVGYCAVAKTNTAANSVCGTLGGFCVPNRNSDPRICEAIQGLARAKSALSLQDPVGIRIFQLQGIWKIKGQQVDINDLQGNKGAWVISRNGRRAVLAVTKGLSIGDEPITSGAQVAAKLLVDAAVVSAPETGLPAWAKTGQESTRAIV
jgi:hypothetical protein